MHNSVLITIFLPIDFMHGGDNLLFPRYLERETDELENPWGLSSHGGFSAFLALIFRSLHLRDALQRVNCVVPLAIYNCYSSYRVF